MSRQLCREALEVALSALSPPIGTAWENVPFKPVQSEPYQAVFLMAAPPVNSEMNSYYREEGYLQVNLQYPLGAGPAAAEARAQMIRDAFPRGRSLTADGLVVNITKTVEIGSGRTEDDRYFLPVRVPFHAHLRS